MLYGSLVRKREGLMREIAPRRKKHQRYKFLSRMLEELTTMQLRLETRQGQRWIKSRGKRV